MSNGLSKELHILFLTMNTFFVEEKSAKINFVIIKLIHVDFLDLVLYVKEYIYIYIYL